jgi:hypothetical protein
MQLALFEEAENKNLYADRYYGKRDEDPLNLGDLHVSSKGAQSILSPKRAKQASLRHQSTIYF